MCLEVLWQPQPALHPAQFPPQPEETLPFPCFPEQALHPTQPPRRVVLTMYHTARPSSAAKITEMTMVAITAIASLKRMR